MIAFLVLIGMILTIGLTISVFQKLGDFAESLNQLSKSISRLGCQLDRLNDRLTGDNASALSARQSDKASQTSPSDESVEANSSISSPDALPGFVPSAPRPRPVVPPVFPPIVPPEPALKDKPILYETVTPKSATGVFQTQGIAESIPEPVEEPEYPGYIDAILEPDEYPMTPQESSAPQAVAPMIERLNVINDYDRLRHEPVAQPSALDAVKAGIDEESVDIFQRGWNWFVLGKEQLEEGDQIEYVAASNWLTRLGMVVLVLGIGFFIKYSINQGWFVPKMQILSAAVVGASMYLWGLRLWSGVRNILGQALIAGGAAVLYFSAYASSEVYQLIRPETSFACAVAITVLLVLSALRRHSELIGTLGMLGAYGTPIMFDIVPRGPYPLLAYLCLLGVGLAVIRRCQRWVIPVWIALFGTWSLFFGLYDSLMVRPCSSSWYNPWPFTFLGLGAVLCVALHCATTGQFVHRKRKLSLWEVLLIIGNALYFYCVAIGFLLFYLPSGVYESLLAWKFLSIDALVLVRTGVGIALAGFFFLQSGLLGSNNEQTRRLWVVCTGLGFLFLVLSILQGRSFTWLLPAWLTCGAAFLYIAQRGESAILTWSVRVASLVLAAVSTFFVIYFCYRISPEVFIDKNLFSCTGLSCRAEFVYGTQTGYWATIPERVVRFLIPALCALVQSWISWRVWRSVLSTDTNGRLVPKPEYAAALETGWLCWSREYAAVIGLIGGLGLLEFLTFETNLWFGVFCAPMRLGAISVLWTIVALGLIFFGLWKDFKPVRMAGLIFFGIILWKIFFVDLSQLDQVYRIIAMVLLGVLILFGGSLYLGRGGTGARDQEPGTKNQK